MLPILINSFFKYLSVIACYDPIGQAIPLVNNPVSKIKHAAFNGLSNFGIKIVLKVHYERTVALRVSLWTEPTTSFSVYVITVIVRHFRTNLCLNGFKI